MYTAIVLDEDERCDLLRTCFRHIGFPEDGWVLRGHHITINMGTFNRDIQIRKREENGYRKSVPHTLGQRCSGRITRILDKPDDGIIALEVSRMRQCILMDEHTRRFFCTMASRGAMREYPIYSVNDVAHITIAHRADVKPRKANDYPLDQWEPIKRKTPIKVAGNLMEVETVDISRN